MTLSSLPETLKAFKELAGNYGLNPSIRETVEGKPFAVIMGRGHNRFIAELFNKFPTTIKVLLRYGKTVVLFRGHHLFQ